MNKSNDWFATVLLNNPSSFEEILSNGITPDNTTIQNADYYKNNKQVQEIFTNEEGKFDEKLFDSAYKSALSTWNDFSETEWTNKMIEEMDKDPYDWTNPMKTNIKEFKVTVGNGYNPERRSLGLTGMNSVGDAVFSVREIAQGNFVRDENGNKLDWTPDSQGGLIKGLFRKPVAIAQYTEDGEHEEFGTIVKHKKGQYKVDENGDYFYEVLGDKDSYGRELLRYSDTLTVDGTTLNKFDVFDSDGLKKGVGSVIAKTVASVAPLFIPGVGQIYGMVGAAATLTSVMPTFLKAVGSIVSGTDDSRWGRGLTKAENWFGQFKETQSDYAKDKLFSLESLGNMVTSSAGQLWSQRGVSSITNLVNKMKPGSISTKVGQALSLGYLAVTSSTDVYGEFKENGASDRAAGLGMLAFAGAMYGLMSNDYFKDQFFKGTWLDEAEWRGVTQRVTQTEKFKRGIYGDIASAVSEGNAASNVVENKKWFNKASDWFKKSIINGKRPTTASADPEFQLKSISKFWRKANYILNRSVNEAVEEVTEEAASDAIKGMFLGLEALGVKSVAENINEGLGDFGLSDLGKIAERYLSSFVGGFVGGATFAGADMINNRIAHHVDIQDKDLVQQIVYYTMTGHGDDLRQEAKRWYDKGKMGDRNLGVNRVLDDEGKEVFEAGTDNNNQNLANYNAVLAIINNAEMLLNSEIGDAMLLASEYGGINDMNSRKAIELDRIYRAINDSLPDWDKYDPDNTWTDEQKLDYIKVHNLSEDYVNEVKKQEKDMKKKGIDDSAEYLYSQKTNALLNLFEKTKRHTSNLDAISRNLADISFVKEKLYKAIQSKSGGNILSQEDFEAKLEQYKDDDIVKAFNSRLKDLRKERNNLLYGNNDDRFAMETIITSSKYASEMMLDGCKINDTYLDAITGNPYWKESKEGYARDIYGKNYETLTDGEKTIIDQEYRNLNEDPDEISKKIRAAEVYYKIIERSSDSIKNFNEKTEGKKLDSWHTHSMIKYNDPRYKEYIFALKQKKEYESDSENLARELKVLEESAKSKEELGKNEEYINKLAAKDKIDDDIKNLDALIDESEKYFRGNPDLLDAMPSELGANELWSKIKRLQEELLDIYRKESEGKTTESLYNGILDSIDFLSKNTSITVEDAITILNTIKDLKSQNISDDEIIDNLKDMGYADAEYLFGIYDSSKANEDDAAFFDSINEDIEVYLKSLKKNSIREELLQQAIDYYQRCKDNGILTEDLFFMNTVVSDIISPMKKAFDQLSFSDKQEKINDMENIPDSVVDIREKDENFDQMIFKYVDMYFENMAKGKYNAAVKSKSDLIDKLKSLKISESDAKSFTKSLFDIFMDGLNVDDSIIKLKELKDSTYNFSLVDIIRDMKVNVGKNTLKLIDVLEKQQRDYTINPEEYMSDLEYTEALKSIPNLLSTIASIMSFTSDGLASSINVYRKRAGKKELFDNVSDDSIDIFANEVGYLLSKTAALLNISESHKNKKRVQHKKAEIKYKTDFIKNLHFTLKDGEAEDSIAKVLEGELGVNVRELWSQVAEGTNVDYDNVTIDNFHEFNTIYFKFINALYESTKNIDRHKVGKTLAKLLPDNSFRIDTGEVSVDGDAMTKYSTIMQLAKVMSLDPKTFYKHLKSAEFNDDSKLVPLGPQEEAVYLSSAIIMDSTIVDEVINGIAEQAKESGSAYIKNMSPLEKFVFVSGGLGSGKSQAVISTTIKVIKGITNNKVNFIFIGPGQSQLDALKEIYGDNKTFKGLTIDELISAVYSDDKFDRYKGLNDENIQHATKLIDFDASKINSPFSEFNNDNINVLIIDEATHLSERDLELLQEARKKKDFATMAVGDLKQPGFISDTGKTSGIEDCICAASVPLAESLRMENVAMEKNYINLKAVSDIVEKFRRANPEAIQKEIEDAYDKASEVAITLDYDENANDLYGTLKIDEPGDKISLGSSYLNKMIEWSKRNNGGVPKVAVITDNVDDWRAFESKGVNIIKSGTTAQGGEFDYVLIDMKFENTYLDYKMFSMLRGRAKKGVVIFGAEKFDKIKSNKEANASSESVSIFNDKDELIEWKKKSYEGIWSLLDQEGFSEGETNTPEEESSSESESAETTLEEKFKEQYKANRVNAENLKGKLNEVDVKPQAPVVVADQTYVDEQKKSVNENIKNKVKNSKISKENFINFVFGDFKLGNNGNEFSFLEDNEFINNEIARCFDSDIARKKFIRLFSSAALFNLDITDDRFAKIITECGVVDTDKKDILENFRNHWNNDASRRLFFRNTGGNDNKQRLIYYCSNINGKENKIPIAILDVKKANDRIGYFSIDKNNKIFNISVSNNEEQTAITRGSIDKTYLLEDALANNGTLSKNVRIFAFRETPEVKANDIGKLNVSDGEPFSRKKNEDFISGNKNIGRSFVLWSEADIVTDEELEEVFKYKIEDGRKVFLLDVDEVAKNKRGDHCLTYKLKNGVVIKLINVERIISLANAYNIVNILNYAVSEGNTFELTNEQRRMINSSDNASIDKNDAMKFIKEVFGGFTLNMFIDQTNHQKEWIENQKKKSNEFRIFSSYGSEKFLGALLYAVTAGGKFNKNVISQNFINIMNMDTYVSKNNIASRNTMTLTYKRMINGKEIKNAFVIKFDRSGGEAKYTIIERAIDGGGKMGDAKKAYHVDAKVLDATAAILSIVNEIAKNSFNRSGNVSIQDLANMLSSGDISKDRIDVSFNRMSCEENVMRKFDESTAKDGDIKNVFEGTRFYKFNDYDLIGLMLNGVQNNDFNEIEKRMRDCAAFKKGIFLNDRGMTYKVGRDLHSDDANKTPWRASNITSTMDYKLYSGVVGINNSTFELNDNSLNKVDESTPVSNNTNNKFTVNVDKGKFERGTINVNGVEISGWHYINDEGEFEIYNSNGLRISPLNEEERFWTDVDGNNIGTSEDNSVFLYFVGDNGVAYATVDDAEKLTPIYNCMIVNNTIQPIDDSLNNQKEENRRNVREVIDSLRATKLSDIHTMAILIEHLHGDFNMDEFVKKLNNESVFLKWSYNNNKLQYEIVESLRVLHLSGVDLFNVGGWVQLTNETSEGNRVDILYTNDDVIVAIEKGKEYIKITLNDFISKETDQNKKSILEQIKKLIIDHVKTTSDNGEVFYTLKEYFDKDGWFRNLGRENYFAIKRFFQIIQSEVTNKC